MRIWVKVLRGFGYVWLAVAGIVISIGIIGVWMKSGFSAVQELLSPFNITNFLLTFLPLAPGIGALIWAETLQAKISRPGT
jgi:hypothetical protein